MHSQKIFLGFVVILLFLSIPVTLLVVRSTNGSSSRADAFTAQASTLAATQSATVTSGLQSPTPDVTISAAPTPITTLISFNILLNGIGNSGDNANVNNYSLSNKNPLHPQRTITVWISNSINQQVINTTGSVNFDPNTGGFTGSIDLGRTFQSGSYIVRIKSDRYLRKLVPGVIQIKTLTDNTIPDVQMVAGDINGDNNLDIRDYNALLDCGFGDVTPLPMLDPNATFNSKVCQAHTPAVNVDLDDDGVVDSSDYNLFLRELAVQNGD